MKCSKVKQLLPEYTGHETGWLKSKMINRHLTHCPDCSAEYRQLQHAIRLGSEALASQDYGSVDQEFSRQILARLPERTKSKKSHTVTTRPFRVAIPALCSLIILICVSLKNHKTIIGNKNQTDGKSTSYPIVESVADPNVTVMTYQTSDPNITIVWFFNNTNMQGG